MSQILRSRSWSELVYCWFLFLFTLKRGNNYRISVKYCRLNTNFLPLEIDVLQISKFRIQFLRLIDVRETQVCRNESEVPARTVCPSTRVIWPPLNFLIEFWCVPRSIFMTVSFFAQIGIESGKPSRSDKSVSLWRHDTSVLSICRQPPH